MLTCNYCTGRAVEVKPVLIHQMFPGPPSHLQGPAVGEQPMPKPLKTLAAPKSHLLGAVVGPWSLPNMPRRSLGEW